MSKTPKPKKRIRAYVVISGNETLYPLFHTLKEAKAKMRVGENIGLIEIKVVKLITLTNGKKK